MQTYRETFKVKQASQNEKQCSMEKSISSPPNQQSGTQAGATQQEGPSTPKISAIDEGHACNDTKPPLDLVCFHEDRSGHLSPRSFGETSSPGGSANSSLVFPSKPAKTFRLQPRTKPTSASTRGRKRGAQCLVPSPATEAPEGAGPAIPEDIESIASFGFELAMESLSIRSPKTSQSPLSYSGHDSFGCRMPGLTMQAGTFGSSFSAYRSPSNSSGPLPPPSSGASGTPRSLVQDSPMTTTTAPLTANRSAASPRAIPMLSAVRIENGSEENAHRQCVMPHKNRPPLHGRATAMILSLDNARKSLNVVEKGENLPTTPVKRPVPVACSPDFTVITKEGAPATPPARILTTPCETPESLMSHNQHSAESTPLPRVKLTPRRTPRSEFLDHSELETPGSGMDLGLMAGEFLQHDHFADTMEKKPPASVTGSSSYLPIPDWCSDPPMIRRQTSPRAAVFRLAATMHLTNPEFMTHQTRDIASNENSDANYFRNSRSPSFIQEMSSAHARAAAMDADGSLSDPDDDHFILADPATLVHEHVDEPARQRQRMSYSSLEGSNLRHSESNSSLAQTHASNTSLLGTDFIMGDSTLSLGNHGRASGLFASAGKMATMDGGLGAKNDRNASMGSLSSIGLPLETANEDQVCECNARDLITPPIPESSLTVMASPPELYAALHHGIGVSGSGAVAIENTINSMRISPQMACHS